MDFRHRESVPLTAMWSKGQLHFFLLYHSGPCRYGFIVMNQCSIHKEFHTTYLFYDSKCL